MVTAVEYAKNFTLFGENKIYLAPDIPKTKLYNALTSFGWKIQPEDTILLLDDTILGSASEGIILTRNHFAWKEIYKRPQLIHLTSNISFSAQKGFLKTFICLNGEKILSVTQVGSDAVYSILRQINAMSEGKFDSATGNSSMFSGSLPNHSVTYKAEAKQCPFCGEAIKAVAVKCRFCGEKLDSTNRSSDVPAEASLSEKLMDPDLYLSAERIRALLAVYKTEDFWDALEDIKQRFLLGNLNAGVAWAVNLMIVAGDSMTPDLEISCGNILGEAASRGHEQARQILDAFSTAWEQRDALTYRQKEALENILSAAAQKM